jgi:hypothetical protein
LLRIVSNRRLLDVVRWRSETPYAAAGRVALAGAIAGGCLGWPGVLRADDGPALFLGPARALSVVEAARRARALDAETEAPSLYARAPVVTARSMPAFVPSRIHIPDGYAIDVERDAPRFAAPVDCDNLVSFQVLDRAVGVFLDYDEESYPIGRGDERLMLQVERRF